MGRSCVFSLCLAGVLACSPIQALADGGKKLKHPLDGQPLQMRTLENPPLAFTNEAGEVVGILVEGIQEAVQRTGHRVDFDIYPWKRVLKEVADGNADAAFSAGKNSEREVWGQYHDTVLVDETYVFFSSRPMSMSRELTEVSELRVGIQLGYYYGERFDQLLQNPPFKSLEVTHTIPRNLELLMAGRTDVFIGDLIPTLYYLRDMGLENRVHIVQESETDLPLVVSTSPTYVAFSRKSVDPAYVRVFDKALESIKTDKTFERIIETYQLEIPELGQAP